MKTKLLLFSLILIFNSISIYSQSGWYWQNPTPSATTTRAVDFLSNNEIFIGGDGGMLLKSTNLGINWLKAQSNTLNSIYCIRFFDNQKGFLSGNGFIKSTSDGGITWINRYSTSEIIYTIFILDANTIYAASNSQILLSTNGGSSWSVKLSFSYLRSVTFINSSIGFAVGYIAPPTKALLFKTYNGGNNWVMDTLGSGFQLTDIAFCTPEKGYITGTSGRVFMTTNQGINWSNIFSTGQDCKRILVLDSNNIFITTFSSLLKTSNGGANWTQQSVGGENFDVSFNSNGAGILTASNGEIFKSTNFGSAWVSIRNGHVAQYDWEHLNNVHFIDSYRGTVVGIRNGGTDAGFGGAIYHTTNGGFTWIPQFNAFTYELHDVFFVNNNTGFIVGNDGYVLKTVNGGNNWVSNKAGIGFSLNGVCFVNLTTGFIVGDNGEIMKTTNTGITWETKVFNTYDYTDIDFYNDSVGAICATANGGIILWTTNCGVSWDIKTLGLSTHSNLHGIVLLNENTALTLKESSIYKTTNSGNNWVSVYSSSQWLNEICFKDSQNGITVGNNGVILKTSNGGQNWSQEQSSTINNLFGCNIRGDMEYTVVGNYLSILSTSDVSTIGIQQINSVFLSNFSLSQNYPNPFNPTTKIKFDVPANVKGQTSNVKLVIYDIIGREITTLVNSELKPGTYEADWDASNFSSGVYFYKIASGDFVETKKMVLMK